MIRLRELAVVAAFAVAGLATGDILQPFPPDEVDELQAASLDKLRTFVTESPPAGGCTLETAVRRREW